MTDAIMNCFSAVASFIAFCMLSVFAMAKPMPYFLLSPSYKKHTPTDVGIGKYKFPEGRGVVCEPDEEYKDYLKKYALFVYRNRKYIKCNLSDDVVSLRYEVAVYNSQDKLIQTLDLAENVETRGETKPIRLPNHTAYVSVVLKSVNEQERFSTLRYMSFAKLCAFSVLTLLMTVACGLLARTAILSISELLDLEWDIGFGVNLVLSTIIGAFVAFLYLVIHKNDFWVKK